MNPADRPPSVGDRRPSSRPWWTVPGVLLGVFAAIVVAVTVIGSVDGTSTLSVEGRDPACEVLRSDEGCVYIITTPSADPLAVVAEVEPTSVASAFEVEADVACDVTNVETPCQITVSADRAMIESAGVGDPQARLVVGVDGLDVTASTDLR